MKSPHERIPNYHRRLIRAEVVERLALADDETRKRGREMCHVCSGFRPVAELHHLLSIRELVRMYELADLAGGSEARGAFSAVYGTAWLCPTDHAIWHLIFARRKTALRDLQECMDHHHHTAQAQFHELLAKREDLLRENRQRLNALFDQYGFTEFRFVGDAF